MDWQLKLVKEFLLEHQRECCEKLAALDGREDFIIDPWQHAQGGGGITRVLQNGACFEQAGVNFSHVYGDTLPAAATQARPDLAGQAFHAVGVSLVIHPQNPLVPTTHANWRFFKSEATWWFGGGFDLTPYYPFIEDCVDWHRIDDSFDILA